MPEALVDDHRFGTVELTADPEGGAVAVAGSQLPPVSLRRTPDAGSDRRSPIGTRAAAQLELVVDGSVAAIDPGLGFVSRRSRRVDVRYADRHYRFTPTANDRSVLLRDGRQLGEFALAGHATAPHATAPHTTAPHAVVGADWDAESDIAPAEAALGYVLAAAFGIGAPGFVKSAIGAGAVAPPF
ncbi:hypothetical protein [Kitasatospora kifunensis]|uniref:Uncharacterized protein n=1 Tax=Kitasatospora kifunensis TaxID=58351 RepID=A0A7W7QWU0_KITKI|nr:hypothetical protein [Kitasatospora kifunensis]MBB4921265.1 hypothetical protein [Kitasatospora kifunensis]